MGALVSVLFVKALLFLAVLLLQVNTNLSHAAASCLASSDERPKIGLVLGGGGARGAAHIGVIRKLEELRIPVDYITGTSMGSIVGGLHATGMSGRELEELVVDIDWSDLFDDATPRADQPFRRKRDDDLSLFGPKLGVGEGASLLPQGAISGQKIAFFFDSIVNQHVQTRDFDRFPIPFRAVAADIITGQQVVLDKGDLGLAMRSSMSIPGVFSPVRQDDYMLVDGGIVNNIPIDVARDMGADIIIAVDVGTPLQGREKLTNLVAITAQLSGFLVVKNSRAQLATLRTNDIRVAPALGETISSSDFPNIAKAIPLGYAAAEAIEDKLLPLALAPEAYASYRQQIRACRAGLPVVQFVEIDNKSRFGNAVINQHIHTVIGQPLNLEQLEKDIQQIYALGFLDSARYEIVEKNDETGIVIHVEQDRRGTQFIEWGLDLFGDVDSSDINVRIGYLKTDVDSLGSEFRGTIQLGEDPGFRAELYKPLDTRQKFIFVPSLFGERREIIQFDDDGDKLNEFQVNQVGVSAAIGREFGRHAAVFLGIQRSHGDVDLEIGDPRLEDFQFDNGAYGIRAQSDRLDDSYFPSSGSLVDIEYTNYRNALGSDDEFEQVRASVLHAWTVDRHTLIGGLRYNTTLDNNAPIQNLFRAGGFTRLSGFKENERSEQHFGMLFGSYRYRFSQSALLPAYVGTTLEYGNAVADRDDIFSDGIFHGSLYFGYRSPIGPVYIGYGFGESGRGNYFLRIGNVFGRSSISR